MATTSTTSATTDTAISRRVLLDTQFVIAYIVASERDHEAACKQATILEKLTGAGLCEVFVTFHALLEAAGRLGAKLYNETHGARAWTALSLEQKSREWRSRRSQVAPLIEGFMRNSWIKVAAIGQRECEAYVEVMRSHSLDSGDLCHLACAREHELTILTNDRDFLQATGLPVPVEKYS